MTWTVLGGHGYIGSRVVDQLHGSGAEVWVPERNDPDLHGRDLGSVIYAAGLTADFRTRKLETIEAHVTQFADLLERADFDSVLYLSSTRVYNGSDTARETDAPTIQPADPDDLYNASKLLGEILAISSDRPTVRVARISNVVGPNGLESSSFLPAIIRQALTGRVQLQSSPQSAKDYIHVDDVVRLLIEIATHGSERLYNVAAGANVTHRRWLDAVGKEISFDLGVAAGAPLMEFPVIDIHRIQNEFGFEPQSVFTVLRPLIADVRHQTRDAHDRTS
ncbi:MAG: NAD-dependent epimerase/dehydratase family protein [Aeromicrobium sp.]